MILANVQPRSQGLFPGGWPGPFLSEKSSKHTRLVSLTILIEPSRGVSKYLTQPILHFRSGSLELLQQQQQALFVRLQQRIRVLQKDVETYELN